MSNQVIAAFNGDADGLGALHLMRRWGGLEPDRLLSGVKRNQALLRQMVRFDGQTIFVFDVAVEKNRAELDQALAAGCRVTWFDHHKSADIPHDHELFQGHIDPATDTNTCRIVHQYLDQADETIKWALVGMYGDNLHQIGDEMAQEAGLAEADIQALREVGELINYNAYGGLVADLTYSPLLLAHLMEPFDDPLRFRAETEVIEKLATARDDDLTRAQAAEQLGDGIYRLPNKPWARRVVGEFANRLARQEPDSAHAVLVELQDGAYVVSVRAALNNPVGAAGLCAQFPTGGGRERAAGINRLPSDQMTSFVDRFKAWASKG